MNDLDGRVVIVTGASGGIGKAIALEVSRRGAKVVAGYSHNSEAATQLLTAATNEMVLVQGNVAKDGDAANLTATALKEFGRVDVLINNAGISRDKLLVRMSEEDWDDVMDINLKGAFLCTKHALRPMMKQRFGKIINISSVAGVLGNAGQANYSASKAGLIGLALTVAQEYYTYGIRGVALVPGIIDSGLGAHIPEAMLEVKLNRFLLGAGPVEQVAGTAAFLCSAASDYINSTIIRLDGGVKS